MRNLDPMRPDDDDSDPLNHELVRRLRGITGLRYAPFLNDPELARKFLLGDTVADEPNEEAQAPGESKNTSPEQDALLLQNRAKGQRFGSDKRIGGVHPGESQPDSETAIQRRKQMSTEPDLEFLENPQAWNRSRRL